MTKLVLVEVLRMVLTVVVVLVVRSVDTVTLLTVLVEVGPGTLWVNTMVVETVVMDSK